MTTFQIKMEWNVIRFLLALQAHYGDFLILKFLRNFVLKLFYDLIVLFYFSLAHFDNRSVADWTPICATL